jgi:hypothetical protein
VTPWLVANLNYPPNLRYLKGYMMLAFLCPGPRKYGLTDSFEYPFIKECKKLAAGIPNVRNSFDDSTFTLRFWPILYSGDGPARSDAMGIVKPGNAKTPCTQCIIPATAAENGTYYIPHSDLQLRGELPRRLTLRQDIEEWNSLTGYGSVGQRKAMGTLLGITRRPLLMDLESLHWPRSFPVDMMHCVLLNIVPNLHELWGGKRFTEDAQRPAVASDLSEPTTDDPFDTEATETSSSYVILDDKIWQYIGETQEKSRAMIPRIMGQGPRPINRYSGGYKAKEWEAWLVRDGPILLHTVPNFRPFLDNFVLLAKIYEVSRQKVITRTELRQLRKNCSQWVRTFEQLYYRNDPARLKVCLINNHSLLHLGKCNCRVLTAGSFLSP